MPSSAEESDSTPGRPPRKSRRPRACDTCRRRKVRCDGNRLTGSVCSNCAASNVKCSYIKDAPKRVPDSGYVQSLEEQLAEMKSLLAQYRQLYPGGVSGVCQENNSSKHTYSATAASQSSPTRQILTLSSMPTPALTDSEPEFEPSEDEMSMRKVLSMPLDRTALFPGKDSFHGKSSSMAFVHAALHSKREYIFGGESGQDGNTASGIADDKLTVDRSRTVGKDRAQKQPTAIWPADAKWRPTTLDAWRDHSWIMRTVNQPRSQFDFPPPDLRDELLSIYFSDMNVSTPVLHQPSFERDVKDGLHLRDEGFGSVLLLVCANAAKKSKDPRVLLEEERIKNDSIRNGSIPETEDNHITYHSAGWKWFEQVQSTKLGISFRPPTLYDMQVAYFTGAYTWETWMSWHGPGYGLRIAQMLGAHRKKSYNARPTVEDELRKRVFWALIQHDRSHSSIFGRPCSMQDEDFDVDLPIICDDEYWLDPDSEHAFKQPEGKPSKVAYFNCTLRLSQILAYALRTIYSINKSKAVLGILGRNGQQHVLSQIDRAMDRWLDSIPAHLRWDPAIESELFFAQSCDLQAAYHTLRIVVHRSFIPTPRNRTSSSASSPSLQICVNAARQCLAILDVQFERMNVVHDQYALFLSMITILLNVWASQKHMTTAEVAKEMQLVHRAMHIVRSMEPWGKGSSKILDTINNLIAMGEQPGPRQSSTMSSDSHHVYAAQADPVDGQSAVNEHGNTDSRAFQHPPQDQSHVHAHPAHSRNDRSTNITSFHPLNPHQHLDDASAWTPASTYASESGGPPQLSSFIDPTATAAISYGDGTMRPPFDPVVDALLSVLSPAQYQQPQQRAEVSPQDAGGSPQGRWNYTIPSHEASNAGIPHTVGGWPPSLHNEPIIPGFVPEFDPSSSWSDAPSGFGWGDWEAYFSSFRQSDNDSTDIRRMQ